MYGLAPLSSSLHRDEPLLDAMKPSSIRLSLSRGAHPKEVGAVRTTIKLDDELLGEARRITDVKGRTALIHEGLRA